MRELTFLLINNLQEIRTIRRLVEHVTCGIFQIFHRGEGVQVVGLRENQLQRTFFISMRCAMDSYIIHAK